MLDLVITWAIIMKDCKFTIYVLQKVLKKIRINKKKVKKFILYIPVLIRIHRMLYTGIYQNWCLA